MRELEIGVRLGAGGQGEVYAALTEDGRPVAVKRLTREPTPDDVHRLAREARLLACIEHTGIVRPVALVRIEGKLALLTELAPGADLARLSAVLRPPPGAVLALASGVAEILAEAVDAPGPEGEPLRLVHRDLRAANVIVGEHGRPRLLDLGLGRSRRAHSEDTASGLQLGALETLAPEAFLHGEDTPARDVFSLAAMCVVLLSGESVYGRRTSRQVASLASSEARFAARMAEAVAGLPAAESLRRALAREPASRPSAATLAEELARAALRGGGSASGWARQALSALPPPADGAWTGRTVEVQPAGFEGISLLSQHRKRPQVGAADPTEKVEREDSDSTRLRARPPPTRTPEPVPQPATADTVSPSSGPGAFALALAFALAGAGVTLGACCVGWVLGLSAGLG